MRRQYRHLAPYGFVLAVIALAFAGGYYIVNRQTDIYFQVSLALVILGVAGGVLLDPARIREALTGRQARYGSNALLLSLAFIGILGVLNYLAYTNPQQWDLTEDREFSLAPESIDLLVQLTQDVRLVGFYTPDASVSRDNIRPLLEEYKAQSNGRVKYEFIDPISNPIAADQYGVTRDRSMVVVVGESSEVVAFPSERELTSAILRLTNPGERKVVFLIGHGERDLQATGDAGYSQLRESLEAKNYAIELQDLLSEPVIASDVLAVVVAGPTVGLAEQEIESLRDFRAQGGSIVVLLDPTVVTQIAPDDESLVRYLESDWGVVVRNDLVVDLNSTAPLAGISFSYANHPITEKLNRLRTYFPTARSLEFVEGLDDGIIRTSLVSTGENSWGEADLEAVLADEPIEFAEGADFAGPLTMAATAEDRATGSRLVVVGDSDFASNSNYFGGGQTIVFANGDLVVNSIDWGAGQESLISLTPKQQTTRFVVPPTLQTLGLIFLITIILLPGGVVLAGLSTWWGRRRRA